MDYLKSKQASKKKKRTVRLENMALLGLMLFACGTCHAMLFGLEVLVWPPWEADHLITEYKFTFIRKSSLNYKGLTYHFAFEKMTYLLDDTNLLWKLKLPTSSKFKPMFSHSDFSILICVALN